MLLKPTISNDGLQVLTLTGSRRLTGVAHRHGYGRLQGWFVDRFRCVSLHFYNLCGLIWFALAVVFTSIGHRV